ncbi:hypothetical protein [Tenacibaculum maritimum]
MGQNNSKQQNNSKDDDIKSFIKQAIYLCIDGKKELVKKRNK